jgi:hypothetical protein
MKRFTLSFLALATALAIAPAALAESYVTGQIGLTLDGTIWTATTPTVVTFADADNAIGVKLGSFTAFAGGSWTSAGSYTFGTPDYTLVTVTEGANTATFEITGPLTSVDVDSGDLVFDATGIIVMSGYLNTPGNIIFNVDDAGGTYGTDHGASGGITIHADPTPEPSSLLLLGTGFLGLAGVAFRRAKSILN